MAGADRTLGVAGRTYPVACARLAGSGLAAELSLAVRGVSGRSVRSRRVCGRGLAKKSVLVPGGAELVRSVEPPGGGHRPERPGPGLDRASAGCSAGARFERPGRLRSSKARTAAQPRMARVRPGRPGRAAGSARVPGRLRGGTGRGAGADAAIAGGTTDGFLGLERGAGRAAGGSVRDPGRGPLPRARRGVVAASGPDPDDAPGQSMAGGPPSRSGRRSGGGRDGRAAARGKLGIAGGCRVGPAVGFGGLLAGRLGPGLEPRPAGPVRASAGLAAGDGAGRGPG